ncbi:GTPase Era [Ketobacter sp. MCCC 1A13808]|uniref:GTPase Era n=1 Tax=Ketobacter sp. MCCC 1A13808 TaxID=2602738 RepID=UPI000F258B15|nr:GTPase Era [Ketobacter sp. MCCC 1A13808]MVF14685.1 GTPase Era [Ketobacter sp. MCCC 1A13808]RLP53947.1 MAG: GTPase Era [Ketobacter sp.]
MTDSDVSNQCGYVAIVGRPNVGKSTLMNHLLGQKISITSRKPQTTRHRVIGIRTETSVQAIYVDTPGIHESEPKAINRMMNRAATGSVKDVDVIVMVVDGLKWNDGDDYVLRKLMSNPTPVILAINKVDTLEEKQKLLPHIEVLSEKRDFAAIVPISALRNQQLDALETEIFKRLPAGEHFYSEDQVTDRSTRFLVAEIVREKLMRQLGKELPYSCSVEIEEFEYDKKQICHISALILVERSSQKRIVIGDKGDRLRKVGSDARTDIETLIESKVMLKLWVKVKSGWSDDERALRSLGYDDGQY